MFQTTRNLFGVSSQPAPEDEVFTLVGDKDSEIREYYADECRCDERDSNCLTKCIDEGDVDKIPDELCQCLVDDKDCFHSCLDDTDPCLGDGDCDDARDIITDECGCDEDSCLTECIDKVLETNKDVCYDQDYECLQSYFQTPRQQLSGKRQNTKSGNAGSLSGSESFGIGLGSVCMVGLVAAVIYKKRQANKTSI